MRVSNYYDLPRSILLTSFQIAVRMSACLRYTRWPFTTNRSGCCPDWNQGESTYNQCGMRRGSALLPFEGTHLLYQS